MTLVDPEIYSMLPPIKAGIAVQCSECTPKDNLALELETKERFDVAQVFPYPSFLTMGIEQKSLASVLLPIQVSQNGMHFTAVVKHVADLILHGHEVI